LVRLLSQKRVGFLEIPGATYNGLKTSGDLFDYGPFFVEGILTVVPRILWTHRILSSFPGPTCSGFCDVELREDADRRWLLYQSNTSDASEIYVRRYSELDRPWQVSAGGGLQPRWNGNREICYRAGSHLMAVEFNGEGAEPARGKPRALFADEYDCGEGLSITNYDITHDGRFIMLRRIADSGNLRVVENWKDELIRLLGAGGTK
jgi:hypothetical protein